MICEKFELNETKQKLHIMRASNLLMMNKVREAWDMAHKVSMNDQHEELKSESLFLLGMIKR